MMVSYTILSSADQLSEVLHFNPNISCEFGYHWDRELDQIPKVDSSIAFPDSAMSTDQSADKSEKLVFPTHLLFKDRPEIP